MVSLNKALLNPYFWGGTLGGGRLTSHEKWVPFNDPSWHPKFFKPHISPMPASCPSHTSARLTLGGEIDLDSLDIQGHRLRKCLDPPKSTFFATKPQDVFGCLGILNLIHYPNALNVWIIYLHER